MASLYIDGSQLLQGAKSFKQYTDFLPYVVSDVLTANALAIEKNAKRRAPADRGQIRQGISTDNSSLAKKIITSHAPHSAYMELEKKKKAAQYVSGLPPDYKTFAAQFQGASGGTFKEFVRLLTEWVKRKKIGATYNVSTRRKNRQTKDEFKQIAYAIAISILRNGVTPHPFMLPALFEQQPKIIKEVQRELKKLKNKK